MTPAPGRDDTTAAADERDAVERAISLALDLQTAVDRDAYRHSVYVNRASLREYLTLTSAYLECPNCITPWKCNGPHVGRGMEL